MRKFSLSFLLASLVFALFAGIVLADDNVQWDGLGHQPGSDLGSDSSYPYFSEDASEPSNKKAVIRLRTYKQDITSANIVYTTDAIASQDSDWTYLPMTWEANVTEGTTEYDSWIATMPSIKSPDTVYYKFQVNDGTDTDWVNQSGEGSSIVADSTTWGVDSTQLNYSPGPNAVTLTKLTGRTPILTLAAGLMLALGAIVAWRRK